MLYRYKLTVLIVCFLSCAVPVLGSEQLVSDNINISGIFQTAAYSGSSALGLGIDYQRFSSDILIGYVPESVGGEDIWSITLKLNLELFDVEISDVAYECYIGARIFYSFDEDSFVQLPDKYPDNYYPSTALRTALAFGIESRVNEHSWFFEVCCLDLYLEAKARNWTELSWSEVLSYGFGYRYHFSGRKA